LRRIGIFVFIVWLELLVIFAPVIDVYNHTFLVGRGLDDAPFYLKLLGEGQSIISAISVLQADRYFHRGIGHKDDDHGHIDDNDEHVDVAGAHGDGIPQAEGKNIFFLIPEQIGVTEHMHLDQYQVKEIIPWLYYAVKMDPHNVGAYVLTSYWVIDRLGKTQEGIRFLREGLKNNPDSWEINAELGRVYFQDTKDYAAAVRVLTRARRLLADSKHDKFQEREVLSFLAYSYKALGKKEDARAVFLSLSQLFPDDRNIKKKIEELS
jgi:tetratricopeptide (TPR) repeat protein